MACERFHVLGGVAIPLFENWRRAARRRLERRYIEAVESMLLHSRNDLHRRRRRREYWDLTHEDTGAPEPEEDPLAGNEGRLPPHWQRLSPARYLMQ